MGFRNVNLQNEPVLSISRSMMNGKKGKPAPKTRIKCECSKCGEVAIIVESNLETEHASCLGMKLSPRAKAAGLRGKHKGIWEAWIDPIVKRTMRIDAWCEENKHLLVHLQDLCEILSLAASFQFLRMLGDLSANKEQDDLNSIRAMTPGAEEIHLDPLPIEGVREDT